MTFPPIRRADPVNTLVLSGEDDEQAAREWADEEAAKIGRIWARRFPSGKDWDGSRLKEKMP